MKDVGALFTSPPAAPLRHGGGRLLWRGTDCAVHRLPAEKTTFKLRPALPTLNIKLYPQPNPCFTYTEYQAVPSN